MIGPGTGVRVYLACGTTDMRKGIEGLAALAQDVLRQKAAGGAVFELPPGNRTVTEATI
jgi:transposase